MELNPAEHDPQLEQSVNQIRNSLSLQEVELVELRELTRSHAISSERLQHLENKLTHLTRDFEASVEELRGEIYKLQQDRETLNKELKTVRQELLLREGEIQSLREHTESLTLEVFTEDPRPEDPGPVRVRVYILNGQPGPGRVPIYYFGSRVFLTYPSRSENTAPASDQCQSACMCFVTCSL